MTPNRQQLEAWNGPEGTHFVVHADRYERQFQPLTDALMAAVTLEPHHTVLDVGCGSGATALAAAPRVDSVLGVDISEPLLGVASERARSLGLTNAGFLVADAQSYGFAPGSFDVVISQLGLMFFDGPRTAFANLRRALAPGGQLAFVCWQGMEANGLARTVSDAVSPYAEVPDLGGLAGGPGMFALKDAGEIAALLESAGFTDPTLAPVAPDLLIGGGGSPEEACDFLLGMGIARGLLGRLEGDDYEAAVDTVRASLTARHVPDTGVVVAAGAWVVTARA